MKIKRLYTKIQDSSFLFGPRGVGKSTFILDSVAPSKIINLLESQVYLELKRNPSHLEAMVAKISKDEIIFIDEIQKLPTLLDEVHRLIESRNLTFILTGSSARKLKREGANLLAGRALTKKMFPFSLKELNGKFPINRLLEIGTLPVVLNKEHLAEDVLSSYVETYLNEEIKQEAITRDITEFVRFLEVSAQLNGHILNFENISSETGKSGDTIKRWYSILEETFIGTTIPSFKPGLKVREVQHSKFYYFDCGVARCAAGLIREDLDPISKGYALETIVLNELKIFNEIKKKNYQISFYAIPGSEEIDFIVQTQKKTINRPASFVSIEVKASKKWKSEYERSSRSLYERSKGKHKKMIGIYLGDEELHFNGFDVYPIATFVEMLFDGKIL